MTNTKIQTLYLLLGKNKNQLLLARIWSAITRCVHGPCIAVVHVWDALIVPLDCLVYACFMYWFWCSFLFWIVKCFEPVWLDKALYKCYELLLLLLFKQKQQQQQQQQMLARIKNEMLARIKNRCWRERKSDAYCFNPYIRHKTLKEQTSLHPWYSATVSPQQALNLSSCGSCSSQRLPGAKYYCVCLWLSSLLEVFWPVGFICQIEGCRQACARGRYTRPNCILSPLRCLFTRPLPYQRICNTVYT